MHRRPSRPARPSVEGDAKGRRVRAGQVQFDHVAHGPPEGLHCGEAPVAGTTLRLPAWTISGTACPKRRRLATIASTFAWGCVRALAGSGAREASGPMPGPSGKDVANGSSPRSTWRKAHANGGLKARRAETSEWCKACLRGRVVQPT